MLIRVGIRLLIVVSSILIIIAGIILLLKATSLWVRTYEMSASSLGFGSITITDAPVLPAFLILFGITSIFMAYRLKNHLNLLACANLGVAIALSFVWFPIYTGLMYAQDYGAPVGWLSYYYDHIEISGGSPEVGVYGLDFLVSAGFWSMIVGTPFIARRGKSLLSVAFLVGAIGYIFSFALYFVQITDSMFFATSQSFSFVESFLFYINSMSSSQLLLQTVYPSETALTNSPLIIGMAVFFYTVGFVGIVSTYFACHQTEDNMKSYREGIIGGIMMIIGSTLLFGFVGGILAIMGAVESKQEPKIKEVQ